MTVAARLQDLSMRFGLPAGAVPQFERLLALVAAEPQALTTVRDPARAVEVHIADSLAALDLAEVRAAGAIADLGSGGGFPGLVLAIALPQTAVTLVESVGRKAAFLARAAEDLELAGVHVVARRAEDWPDGLGAADVVTARALAPLAVLLEYAAPLLRPGGALVAWKGRPDDDELRDAQAAAKVLGMSPPQARTVPADLVRGADERRLYLSSTVGPLPPGYPRRPGMARKRPLQGSTSA